MSTKLLGTLCLIGGAAYVVMAVYNVVAGIANSTADPLSNILGILWIVGAICGWVGFFQLRGTGGNVAIRFLTLIPVFGLALVLVLTLYARAAGADPFDNPLLGVGLLVELVGIVLNAIFAIATKALSGWRRFAPLMVLAGFIMGGLIGALSNGAVLGIPLGLGVGYMALGYAVQSRTESRAVATAAA